MNHSLVTRNPLNEERRKGEESRKLLSLLSRKEIKEEVPLGIILNLENAILCMSPIQLLHHIYYLLRVKPELSKEFDLEALLIELERG